MDETTLASLSHLDDAQLAIALANGGASSSTATSSSADHGWQKVTYPKRHRRGHPAGGPGSDPASDRLPNGSHVFDSVDKKANERHRSLAAAAAAAAAAEQASLAARIKAATGGSDDDEDESGEEGAPKENGADEVKKIKQKKPKKPKVTVAEAAAKIDAGDLAAFLVDITSSYETQPDIQLMRFADYFGRSFSAVTAPQFPWQKMLKETPLAKIVDIPVSHIPEPVYKTAVDWIAQRPVEALGNFVLWSLDCILAELAGQVPSKGSKKTAQPASPKAQVAIFLVLAMTLRRKPDVLINLLPTLRDNSKYQGADKLPVMAWAISQASQGDLSVGVYSWSRNLLPLLSGKSGANPQIRDLVLQSVERFLAIPKARTNLVNNAVRKGERVVPPAALEQLLRATFPNPRAKETDRFEAVYPTLKDIALAGSAGSKALKPVAQQLLSVSAKLLREKNPGLLKEATDIFIWCLAQNTDCFRQWESIYLDNLEASVSVLKKLSVQWRDHSAEFSPDVVREAVKKLRIKNEEALSEEGDDTDASKIKEADKYCKAIAGKVAKGPSCVTVGALLLTVGVAATALVYPYIDLNELSAALAYQLK